MTKHVQEPFVSIIMPAYNAQNLIADSIRSVKNQTYKNWELIIIDDGSTDRTSQAANEFSKHDSRIKYIYQTNQRLGAARNTGIKTAKGNWIAFLDSDDLWHELKLEKQIQLCESQPDIDVIYTGGWVFHDNDLTDLKQYPTRPGKFSSKDMYVMEYHANYIPILSVLVKKSVIDKVGFQQTEPYFFGCEDLDYWIRMAREGASFFGMEEKLFYYRRHSNSMSNDTVLMRLSEASALLSNYDPTILSKEKTQKIFKPILIPLLIDLIKKQRINDGLYILQQSRKIIPVLPLTLSLIAVNTFKSRSVFFLRIIKKVLYND